MIPLFAGQHHLTSSSPFTTQKPSKSAPIDSGKDIRRLHPGTLAAIFIITILVVFVVGVWLGKTEKCYKCGQNGNGTCCSLFQMQIRMQVHIQTCYFSKRFLFRMFFILHPNPNPNSNPNPKTLWNKNCSEKITLTLTQTLILSMKSIRNKKCLEK